MLRRHPNSPANSLIDNAPYFITGAADQKRKLLQDAGLKQLLLNKIGEKTSQLGWTVEHWVILDRSAGNNENRMDKALFDPSPWPSPARGRGNSLWLYPCSSQ